MEPRPTGCDGAVREYVRDGTETNEGVSVRAHAGPVERLATTIDGNAGVLISSGSADHVRARNETIVAHGVCDGGHSNAIESVALCANNNNNNDWRRLQWWTVFVKSARGGEWRGRKSNDERRPRKAIRRNVVKCERGT